MATTPLKNAGGASSQAQMREYFHYDIMFDDGGDGFHIATAEFTISHVEGEDAGEKPRPRDTFLFEPAIFILNFEGFLDVSIFFYFFFNDLWDHKAAELRVRSEDSVKAS